jgi:hypothetical protein
MVEISNYNKENGDEVPTGVFVCRTPNLHGTVNQNKRNSVQERSRNERGHRGRA